MSSHPTFLGCVLIFFFFFSYFGFLLLLLFFVFVFKELSAFECSLCGFTVCARFPGENIKKKKKRVTVCDFAVNMQVCRLTLHTFS